MKDNDYMLTTTDNPYNPFTQFEEWLAFDEEMGYNTNGYLARIAKTSINLPDYVNDKAIQDAMDEIVSLNLLGVYIKVTKDSFKQKDV